MKCPGRSSATAGNTQAEGGGGETSAGLQGPAATGGRILPLLCRVRMPRALYLGGPGGKCLPGTEQENQEPPPQRAEKEQERLLWQRHGEVVGGNRSAEKFSSTLQTSHSAQDISCLQPKTCAASGALMITRAPTKPPWAQLQH